MPSFLELATSVGATLVRLGAGYQVDSAIQALHLGEDEDVARPEQRLVLYDFEACPFCRKAREALSHLDLEAEIRPAPKGGERYRVECKKRGGREMFPYLIDPNTGSEMYESDDIVRYLYDRYGAGDPRIGQTGLFPVLTGSAASLLRGARGTRLHPSKEPKALLELWSFEASPFCRLVREKLSELEIPYILHNVAKGSRHREAFVARSGKMQVPFLVDPNTGEELFESSDIVDYLEATYAL